jgi:uncharacterized protein (TIGR02444 family)
MQDSSALWQFSLALYAAPGVSHACIQLQDHWQANINLILWLVWLEQRNQPVDSDLIVQAEAAIAPWSEQTLQPLRALRRLIGSQRANHTSEANNSNEAIKEDLYQQLKAAELLAEKIEQRTLVQLSNELPSLPTINQGSNLNRYLDRLQIPVAERQELLACLYTPTNIEA